MMLRLRRVSTSTSVRNSSRDGAGAAREALLAEGSAVIEVMVDERASSTRRKCIVADSSLCRA